MSTQEKVIACSLSSAERKERAARWQTLGSYDVEQLDNGLRLVFANDVTAQLQELATLEAGCCAFAAWTAEGNTIEITAATAEAIAAVNALGF
jgi:hypothetical protein